MGWSPSDSSMKWWDFSEPKCEAIVQAMEAGASFWASRAAAPQLAPSNMTSFRWSAAPRMRPAMQPNSKPPTLARMSMASSGSGRLTCRARRTTSTFFWRRASEIFVPRPVTSSGDSWQQTAVIAALAVVLAMPISPGRNQSKPCSARDFAMSRPALMESVACSRVMAGPSAMFLVPLAMRVRKRPGRSPVSAAMPMSSMRRWAPA